VIAPIGASPQTIPVKFSNTNDTLDRVPIVAWPLGLSDQQRQRIYSAVMADKNAPATDTGDLGRASELPTEVALNELHDLPHFDRRHHRSARSGICEDHRQSVLGQPSDSYRGRRNRPLSGH
jgi:hypothetical protein